LRSTLGVLEHRRKSLVEGKKKAIDEGLEEKT